ncbi:Calvin cycle protein CP12 [Cylindrospermopsis raciborskii]|uniref:CP12 domain-containing protein n=1 Tax=Cylindrospermopsis raciborskii CENA302 TaxID=1170768 RepID=A0A9Q5WAK6_9CYAN|nr:Calvin cycle protein CP12 [Cylindrospermopsis raciborskii]MCZ2201737.1 Calvin cycle protein CP12 [Cylindrospermopsis raciborskii PAMP2012]MCZ2204964.1 Calvin cycle protein CP12 [Cylindrospermopsis raciborskii PAMP2011]NLQ04435.1 hypothetical protein [Cylindrospermopsis raciborskii MVCC19]OHY32071.1 hypothetical protein BCV64_14060 [Cylindrospermopsis raciborskii MVCC14]OPH10692.1 hypothetical protein CENA302_03340 [Cylindrospermopsis raciborskii CENA302]
MKTVERVDTTNNSPITQPQNIQQAILAALTQARQVCDQQGDNSPECAVAWDRIEELQAQNAHQQQLKHYLTSLESYCERYPDAVECLIYDL